MSIQALMSHSSVFINQARESINAERSQGNRQQSETQPTDTRPRLNPSEDNQALFSRAQVNSAQNNNESAKNNSMSNIKEQVDKAVKSSKELQLLRPFMSQQQNQNIAGKSEESSEGSNESQLTQALESSGSLSIQSIDLEQMVVQQARSELEISSESQSQQQIDPLVFDLDNNGFHTTGTSKGVFFDLDADGRLDKMSNLSGADAFLALDKNNNGRIDNGSELFGDQNGAAHGFDELSKYDDNQDGVIDKQDAIFEDLRLVQITAQGQQSMRLADNQIQSIALAYKNGFSQTLAGDHIAQTSQSKTTSGDSINIADIKLNIISK
jgi:hypothetical protein